MEVEVDDRQQTGTWKLVTYSADNNLVASKCVYIGSNIRLMPLQIDSRPGQCPKIFTKSQSLVQVGSVLSLLKHKVQSFIYVFHHLLSTFMEISSYEIFVLNRYLKVASRFSHIHSCPNKLITPVTMTLFLYGPSQMSPKKNKRSKIAKQLCVTFVSEKSLPRDTNKSRKLSRLCNYSCSDSTTVRKTT